MRSNDSKRLESICAMIAACIHEARMHDCTGSYYPQTVLDMLERYAAEHGVSDALEIFWDGMCYLDTDEASAATVRGVWDDAVSSDE